jgi:ribosomal subunit interface protein
MDITITARHFKAPKELQAFAEKEVRKLSRYFNGMLTCHVVLSRESKREVAEIIAHSKKHQFTVIESSQKMDRAVVLAAGKLKTQITRYKDKLTEK